MPCHERHARVDFDKAVSMLFGMPNCTGYQPLDVSLAVVRGMDPAAASRPTYVVLKGQFVVL